MFPHLYAYLICRDPTSWVQVILGGGRKSCIVCGLSGAIPLSWQRVGKGWCDLATGMAPASPTCSAQTLENCGGFLPSWFILSPRAHATVENRSGTVINTEHVNPSFLVLPDLHPLQIPSPHPMVLVLR